MDPLKILISSYKSKIGVYLPLFLYYTVYRCPVVSWTLAGRVQGRPEEHHWGHRRPSDLVGVWERLSPALTRTAEEIYNNQLSNRVINISQQITNIYIIGTEKIYIFCFRLNILFDMNLHEKSTSFQLILHFLYFR